jgi:glycosyltransferase involved in cell wall biosynthesis
MILPLVSIAIVTYNQKDFLNDCIESCLNQDYKNIEIVVANDGSTDETIELLANYNKKYPNKFKIITSEINQGITKNHNLAHHACTGKYIAWMGGDDIMLPNKISKQVHYMESNPDCTICYHNLEVFDSISNNIINYFNDKIKYTGDVHTSIRNGSFNGACSTLVRREKTPIDGFNVSLPVASDWLYWIETLHNGGTIDYIDEVLGRYRRHDKNSTRTEHYISQGETDVLLTCQIIFCKYPQYFNDALVNYSKRLITLRHRVNYFDCLLYSFKLKPSIRSSLGLIAYVGSFGYLKL